LIAVDTNILVYAHRKDNPWHEAAYECMRTLAEGLRPWFIGWPNIHEFIAIITHPRIFSPASTLQQAFDQIDAWMESPSLTVAGEGEGYIQFLREVSLEAHIKGPMIHDAHVAALCLEYGIDELWSADRDFSRFSGIKVRNPLRD
jgi:uncharacterized protein